MSFTPLTFSGVSTYSSDFQAIIDRAVSIATIPLTSLQNQQSDVVSKKMLVGNLSGAVASLSAALKNLGAVSAAKSLVASSSDSSKVTAANTGSSSAATYTISDITSLAKVASESSAISYADGAATPVASNPAAVKLIVGGEEKILDISGNNSLEGLRDAINASGLGATATILTVSPTENYLSVSANSAGATTLKIIDDPEGAATGLLTGLNQGANTVFKLNGAPVSTDTTQITSIIPGVTLNILGTTGVGGSVDVSVGTDGSSVANALQAVVTAYNSLRDEVNGQIGENAGLLTGDYLVRLVQDNMRQLSGFSGNGPIQSLADLGIEFDTTGHASFNQSTFDALPESSMNDIFAFLGTESTGLGGLSSVFDEISDPVTGLAKLQSDQYDNADQRLSDEISTTTDEINRMQESLASKLTYTDALIGMLESQQQVVDASIQSLNLVLYGKKDG